MTKITYKKSLAALKELDPDFVYPAGTGCKYVKEDKPSCGVGQIMHHDFGIKIKDLKKWDDGDAGIADVIRRMALPDDGDDYEYDSDDEGADLRDQNVTFTMKAEMLLTEFQRCQDTGYVTWATAVENAERLVKRQYGR